RYRASKFSDRLPWHRRRRSAMTEAAPVSTTPASAADASAAIAAAFQKADSTPKGLSSQEAAARLQRFGRTALDARADTRGTMLAGYFWGPLPWMIEAAALISALRGDWPDFAVVAGMLLYNAVVGFWQDNKAANALAELQKGLAPKARVLRDGEWRTIDAAELVPGDGGSVAAGPILPADRTV